MTHSPWNDLIDSPICAALFVHKATDPQLGTARVSQTCPGRLPLVGLSPMQVGTKFAVEVSRGRAISCLVKDTSALPCAGCGADHGGPGFHRGGQKSVHWYSTVQGRSTVETQSVNPLNPHSQIEKVALWGPSTGNARRARVKNAVMHTQHPIRRRTVSTTVCRRRRRPVHPHCCRGYTLLPAR